MTSLVANHFYFDIQNDMSDSTAWSGEASLNTFPAIDVTIIHVVPLADILMACGVTTGLSLRS